MTDHPDIDKCERYGYPDGPRKWPICPVCGEECDTYYRDSHGEILGCESCIDTKDAWDEMEGYE